MLVWNDPWDAQLISWQFGYRGVLKVTRGGRHEGYEERGGTIDQTLSLESRWACVDSGSPFRFILSPCKARVSDGRKKLVLFLFKIDIEEALSISIPEEVAEFVDETPDFQGNLNFLLIFHFSPS